MSEDMMICLNSSYGRRRYSSDATQRGDDVASDMRDYYEANRPLRWWKKRNPPGSWGGIADNLMLGLRNIVLDAERGYQLQLSQKDRDDVQR